MSRRDGLVWCPQQHLKQSYLFVSLGEVGFVHFVHSHDDGYHILPIHDGGSQDALGLILGEAVHKVTEMLILEEGRGQDREVNEYKGWESISEPLLKRG